jgi:hypothetical protein
VQTSRFPPGERAIDAPPIRTPDGAPTTAQVALGLFIVGQVLFLFTANLLPMLHLERFEPPAEPGVPPLEAEHTSVRAHLHDAAHDLEKLCWRWQHLTGQAQGWALFSAVCKQSTFLALDVHCADVTLPLRVPSPSEPPNGPHRFKPPGTSRVSDYEFYVFMQFWDWDETAVRREPERWRSRLDEHLREQWPRLQAYLRWGLRSFREAHPDCTITHVDLIARRFALPDVEGERKWGEPVETPILRWRPDAETPADRLPFEMFDPATRQFVSVPAQPGGRP